jgi:hypothetical protein
MAGRAGERFTARMMAKLECNRRDFLKVQTAAAVVVGPSLRTCHRSLLSCQTGSGGHNIPADVHLQFQAVGC